MRYNFCVVCGEDKIIHQHHFVPKYLGGGNEEENMLTLCPTHHYLLHQYMQGIFTKENKIKASKVDTSLSSPAKEKPKQGKVFSAKEFVFENQQDIYIYRDNRTKTKIYHIRIYNPKTKEVWSKSLKTADRINAIHNARKIYAEQYPFEVRGV
jgi:hypothetical protein